MLWPSVLENDYRSRSARRIVFFHATYHDRFVCSIHPSGPLSASAPLRRRLQYILKEGEPPIVSSKQELYEMVMACWQFRLSHTPLGITSIRVDVSVLSPAVHARASRSAGVPEFMCARACVMHPCSHACLHESRQLGPIQVLNRYV